MDNKKSADENNQGFNDDELADIMNEIEGLERDLNSDVSDDETIEATADVVDESVSHTKSSSVMEDFVAEPLDKVLPFTNKSPDVAKVKTEHTSVSNSVTSGKQTSTMDFNITGNMAVNLTFTVSGQTINLTMDESTGLVIEMHGGAKFVLPLNAQNDVKKKAS
ncbi:MAG: hypothetical protein ACOYL6_00885 [Bacteriovoracaceae bacterium]